MTVKDLIKELQDFDENKEIRLQVAWYDRNNFNIIKPDRYKFERGQGIDLYVMYADYEDCVIIENMNTEDMDIYD